jgi:hypothetical protein
MASRASSVIGTTSLAASGRWERRGSVAGLDVDDGQRDARFAVVARPLAVELEPDVGVGLVGGGNRSA